ncbi:MAG: hypothetical protein M3167_04225 [Acidobacteriota bacterium]|nr:hypothetical protein [Acidobacteriota bacterium]
MRSVTSARLIAGALLFAAVRAVAQPIAGAAADMAPAPAAPPRLQLATSAPDGLCPDRPGILGISRLDATRTPPADSSRCLVIVEARDLSDTALSELASRLARFSKFGFALLDLSASEGAPERIPFAVKRLSSAVRAVTPDARVGLDLGSRPAGEEDLSPYADALVLRAEAAAVPPQSGASAAITGRWILLRAAASGSGASDVIRALEGVRRDSLGSVSLAARESAAADEPGRRQLERMQAYLTADVSPDPTPTTVSVGPESYSALRFFEAKRFTPIVFLHESPLARLELADGTYASASVENLGSGARREFDLKGAKSLALDASKSAFAVVLHPTARPGGESRAVEVGAVRGLTAEEIVARERAWETGQREKVESFVGQMKASLRFRVAEVNETFDLTILGPFFSKRGEPSDWEWDEFYLNGVKWKGKTLPSLPILQPEKVTTLPLEIRLTEEYTYELHAEAAIAGRRAYHVAFNPKSSVGAKPVYRGSVWIDKETFALLRRDSVQLNLKGETLSNVQSEFYRPVPGHSDVLLPLEIKGQQVFSTAGRTTAIERDVVLQNVQLNPPDFAERRAKAYASPAQMIRDTDVGMRYLIPDPAVPGARIVQTTVSRKSTFGILGGFYDKSLDYPIPLIGVQHFNFDLFGKGKQLSVFFGGALLTTNYTDPGIGGTRLDLGLDLFGSAVAFGDVAYRNGHEVSGQKIKHLPAIAQLNLGHPLGPYLKASLGIFAKYDNYQRDKNTAATFITPVDAITSGVDLKLIANLSGFNATVAASYFNRSRWELWGDPSDLEYKPSQKDYIRWEASLSKDQYFSGFRKLHAKIGYVDGSDLDRFSKYEFGSFSPHPMHGFQSGSLRTQRAWVANLSYGLNIEDIIRFEGFYDQALLTDSVSGFKNTYFSGAGLLASLNGPWKNSLFRAEVGMPVVRHGVAGFVVNVLVLKLF